MKEKVIERRSVCGITYVKRERDRATSMLLHELELSVTATNPDDVERLFNFVREKVEDLEKE